MPSSPIYNSAPVLTLARKQEVTSHTQQLEALEARLRETEERLKQAKSSPPSRKGSQRRSPIEDAFPDDAKERLREAGSPSAARRKPQNSMQTQEGAAGASPDTPTSDKSTEYVMVARPRSARHDQGETA